MIRCEHCDFDELEGDESHCPSCGASLRQTTPLLIGIGLALGFVVLIGVIWFALPPSRSTPVAPVARPSQPAAPGGALTASQVIEQTTPAVVSVLVPDEQSQGSGWLALDGKRVVTNAHVVGAARRVIVRFASGKEVQGTVTGTDPSLDVAVVTIAPMAGIAPLQVGEPAKLTRGEEVLAFGSPLGLEGTVTNGIVSGFQTWEKGPTKVPRMIQISAPIAPGSSGGPLVLQATGQVVGMTTGAVQGDHGSSFGMAVPVDLIMAAVKRIEGK